MCFTVSIYAKTHSIETAVGATFDDDALYTPYVHVSGFVHPHLPVVANNAPTSLRFMSWGIVPAWARSAQAADEIRSKTLNARVETMFEKPSYRRAAAHHRGLLPIQGFIEWHQQGTVKIPYYVRHRYDKVFTLACLCEEWVDTDTGEIVPTFSIVTTPANGLMSWLHNGKMRMPLVVEPQDRINWLHNTSRADVQRLQCPLPDGVLQAHQLSRAVSKVKVNMADLDLLEPVGETLVDPPSDGNLFL